ncbi:MAG: hypothetical protein A2579_12985 [Lysobacterales bacterium RIFOXYD1_FULL_69_11]|nr:MAG: hypothetical protein A2579_12985 [Xanthomonadales bacterium RIFOXYD1_FULL_69_11]
MRRSSRSRIWRNQPCSSRRRRCQRQLAVESAASSASTAAVIASGWRHGGGATFSGNDSSWSVQAPSRSVDWARKV